MPPRFGGALRMEGGALVCGAHGCNGGGCAAVRLPDLATSARNALSDGAALASRALPVRRRLARRFVSPTGSIELTSVLAGDVGKVTCRFRVRFEGDVAPKLEFWWLNGRVAALSARLVSRVVRTGDGSEAVYSVSVPSSTLGFVVGAPGVGTLTVSRHEMCRLERRRDDMMVNPGIDERYWHATADAPCPERSSRLEAEATANPLMSIIVPLYKTPVEYFCAMVDSVLGQTYGNWELVLVNASPHDEPLARALARLAADDDPRIVVIELDENKGISENTVAGIDVASGDYLSFLDHDDLLAPNALEEYVREIRTHPQADLLYCDEDSVTHDGRTCFEARFKPDFNIDLLLTHNYVCHFLTVSAEAYEQVAPYGHDVDGAQDYDLTLKVSEVARDIRHIPKVLYHWRQHDGSTNGGATAVKPYVVESSINAISRYLGRRGMDARVTPTDYPCVFEVEYPANAPADVSLVVAYDADEELADFLESLETQRLRSVCQLIEAGPSGGSYAARVNAAVAQATGEYVLIVDGRVRFVSESDCIGALRGAFCREEVGVASAKAMALDGHVLHAGLCVREDASVGYLNQGFVRHMGGGYLGLAECDCSYSAIAPLCFMVRVEDYREAGGLDEEYVDAAAQMIDFSFRLREQGKVVIVRPSAVVLAIMDVAESELGGSCLVPHSADGMRLWESHDASYQMDVLGNPNLDLSTGYLRWNVTCA